MNGEEKGAWVDYEEIDLRRYLGILVKWKWLVAAVTVLAVATTGILSFFVLPPVYEARALLLVTQEEERHSVSPSQDSLESTMQVVSRLPEMTVNTYASQIKNEVVFSRVIERLGLDKNLYSPSSLAGMVKVQAIKDTNLIEVRVQNTNSKLAADIANAICEEFSKFVSENTRQQMTKSVEFLQEQQAATSKDLAAAMEKLKKFQQEPRSVEYLTNEMNTLLDNLAKYKTEADAAEIAAAQLEAAISKLEVQLAETPPKIKVQDVRPVLEDNGETAVPIEREEVNPAYTALQQEINNKKASLAEKRAQAAGLNSLIGQVEKRVKDLQMELTQKRMEEDKLMAEVESLKKAYNILSEKIVETKIAKSVNLGETDLLIASKAMAPTDPVKPKKSLNMALALVLGLIVGVILAFVAEHFDNTIRTPEDVERYLGLAVLGKIPQVEASETKS
ncbi:GumC family protein [Thermanaeromonas sp. C210]|uniref:GumC family protein n=1 Tax=Thermanaeromonas sp. C210 TaxID=2731925 RepID=UPI00155C1760|nr:Wzz/FepE/Etk N-terminal domain-containing protein [Thermanaeromonas sp. C210]GFN23700.1 hypothetical protein TAMC210_20170 [Thermanaeromonas sp. C210]